MKATQDTRNRIAQYVRERDEALLSLDEAKIRAFAKKWNLRMQHAQGLDFWGGVHKARATITTFAPPDRALSVIWLEAHGMSPRIEAVA